MIPIPGCTAETKAKLNLALTGPPEVPMKTKKYMFYVELDFQKCSPDLFSRCFGSGGNGSPKRG
jgi:hypothetical protein